MGPILGVSWYLQMDRDPRADPRGEMCWFGWIMVQMDTDPGAWILEAKCVESVFTYVYRYSRMVHVYVM